MTLGRHEIRQTLKKKKKKNALKEREERWSKCTKSQALLKEINICIYTGTDKSRERKFSSCTSTSGRQGALGTNA